MANRVQPVKVKELIPTSLADEVLASNMIATAHLFVDDNLLSAGLSVGALTNIELYLAAHFVAVTDEAGGIVSDTVGSAEVELSDVYGPGFNSTRFGQMAMVLDTSGTLSNLGTPKMKAELRVV